MANGTQIEWTDATWNPVTGCSKITAGCDNCYAERFSERFRGVPDHPFENGFDLTLRPARLTQPLSWKTPRRVFVNSMSDLFHKEVPRSFIDKVFDTMEKANWHTFQVLTKRSSLLTRYLNQRYRTSLAPSHIWLGVSVEDAKNAVRIKHLKDARASMKFVSFEPLIGPVGRVDLSGIDWVIVGGESGPRARPMEEAWALEMRDQCRIQNVAFFFKQWGGIRPKSGGRKLKGREWNQYPKAQPALAVRPSRMVALADYAGREQSYVKHVFLENYLEALAHKTASTYPHIVYVDGFAGPWQSANERFEDTSFGIALSALRQAKESWKQMGRNVRMSAHLVERDATAYAKLEEVPKRFPDVSVSTYSGDFVELIPTITQGHSV